MKLKALGHNVRIITPSEGYRGWFGGLALSSEMPNWALHASYDYLNWWLDGPAGAHLCRQGGYFSNQKSNIDNQMNHDFVCAINCATKNATRCLVLSLIFDSY